MSFKPSLNIIENSNLFQFINWLKNNKSLHLNNYQELWQWSIDEIELFWKYCLEYFRVNFYGNKDIALKGNEMPYYQWFPELYLSYSENIFSQKNDEQPALIFQNEFDIKIEISWSELETKVLSFQKHLIKIGVKKGDRVVAYIPNIPESIISFLAVNSIGAIWSSCSQDFGIESVLDRFKQLNPKVFITSNGYSYNKKLFNKLDDIYNIANELRSLKDIVLIEYINNKDEIIKFKYTNWRDIISKKYEEKLKFEKVGFNHPLWILFSSGTTGKPKAIVHSTGGNLIEHYKYLAFHNNLKRGERFFWFTTTGWMMWNFSVSSLLLGNILVLYDGNPNLENPKYLWNFALENKINHFGTSAPFIINCMKEFQNLGFELPYLKSISSTGSPLPKDCFDWIYKTIKKDIFIWSMSGGTDICSAFVGGNAMLEVHDGEIQSRALGVSLFAYNENQKEVIDEVGEMVITKPMPSMPIYFWNDDNYNKYLDSYFSEYKNIWRHGDWIKITKNNGIIIYGRSDATLNRNGIRIGTAEIYNVLNTIKEIKDALIVNIENKDGSHWMPLFVITESLTEDLKKKINSEIKIKCSPRHVPDEIIKAPDIPYTINNKKMETIVKKILMKIDISSQIKKDSLRNPTSLEFYKSIKSIFKKEV